MTQEKFRAIMDQVYQKRNVVLIGKEGVGKTFLLNRIKAELEKNAIKCILSDGRCDDFRIMEKDKEYVILIDNVTPSIMEDIIRSKVQYVVTTANKHAEERENQKIFFIEKSKNPDEAIKDCKSEIAKLKKIYRNVTITDEEIRDIFFKSFPLNAYYGSNPPQICLWALEGILTVATYNHHEKISNDDILGGIFCYSRFFSKSGKKKYAKISLYEAAEYFVERYYKDELGITLLGATCMEFPISDGSSVNGCCFKINNRKTKATKKQLICKIIAYLAGEAAISELLNEKCGTTSDNIKKAAELSIKLCNENKLFSEQNEKLSEILLNGCFRKARKLVLDHMVEIIKISKIIYAKGYASSIEIDGKI